MILDSCNICFFVLKFLKLLNLKHFRNSLVFIYECLKVIKIDFRVLETPVCFLKYETWILNFENRIEIWNRCIFFGFLRLLNFCSWILGATRFLCSKFKHFRFGLLQLLLFCPWIFQTFEIDSWIPETLVLSLSLDS